MTTRAPAYPDMAAEPGVQAIPADRTLSPAAGILLAMVLGAACWIGLFSLIR